VDDRGVRDRYRIPFDVDLGADQERDPIEHFRSQFGPGTQVYFIVGLDAFWRLIPGGSMGLFSVSVILWS
jgi:hypothetical protein